MKLIGLTGGIGAGKSTVSNILRETYDLPVIDADGISRGLTFAGGGAIPVIQAIFGRDYITPDGAMDRVKMGHLICEDNEAKAQLEGIIHPLVISEMQRSAERFGRESGIVIYDCPLLFEVGQDTVMDRVVTVIADEAVRIARIMQRDGIDADFARRKIALQISDEVRCRKSDDIIENNGDLVTLKNQIGRLVALWQSSGDELSKQKGK